MPNQTNHRVRTRAATLCAALCASLLAACATAPSAAVLQDADYGPAPDGGHQRAIRAAFVDLLIDPASAEFEFGAPEQGWGNGESAEDFVFGWTVATRINSKNQFGGFTGWRDYKTLLVDGQVHSIYVTKGEDLLGNQRFERVR